MAIIGEASIKSVPKASIFRQEALLVVEGLLGGFC